MLGGVAGFLFGLFVGLALLLFGVVPTDSVVVSLLLPAGLAAGIALADRAPIRLSPSSSAPAA